MNSMKYQKQTFKYGRLTAIVSLLYRSYLDPCLVVKRKFECILVLSFFSWVLLLLVKWHSMFDLSTRFSIRVKVELLMFFRTELMRRVKRYQFANHSCLLIKYEQDDRYDERKVSTHDKFVICLILYQICITFTIGSPTGGYVVLLICRLLKWDKLL